MRWLLFQGVPARGHNDTHDSHNKGEFIKLLKFHYKKKAKFRLKIPTTLNQSTYLINLPTDHEQSEVPTKFLPTLACRNFRLITDQIFSP